MDSMNAYNDELTKKQDFFMKKLLEFPELDISDYEIHNYTLEDF